MRTTTIPTPVLAVALHACTTEPELLNSERIAQTFGSYGIDVLQADGALRRSNLYSVSDGLRTCRTCGNEYKGRTCPHCEAVRRRLRGG